MKKLHVTHPLYLHEPQYLFNPYEGLPIGNFSHLPCGALAETSAFQEETSIQHLPKGRVWFSMNTEAFIDGVTQYHSNQRYLQNFLESEFKVSILTTSKIIMKHIVFLQHFSEIEVGVLFHSDKEPHFATHLEVLRRVVMSDIKTYAYIVPSADIDVYNLSELLGGLVHHVVLYGTQHQEIVGEVMAEYGKNLQVIP